VLERSTRLDLPHKSTFFAMLRFVCSCLIFLAAFSLAGCDNRTQEARRLDIVAKDLKSGVATQPWKEATDPWSNAEHPTGTAW
jgi:hypothetical protein